jgi:hypothetical protein
MVESSTSNTDVSSVILDLETLTAKYDKLLIQYKQAQADYMSYLKQPTSSTREFSRTKGNAFYSSSVLSSNATENIDKCEALCAANPLCTGATFGSKDKGNTCFTYSGQGTDTISNPWETSIVVKKTFLANKMKSINDKLMSLNEEIMTAVNNSQPMYDKQKDERAKQKQKITENSDKLKKELLKIKKLQQEATEGEEKNNEAVINMTQDRYIYIAVCMIVALVMFVLFTYVLGSSSSSTPVVNQQINPANTFL